MQIKFTLPSKLSLYLEHSIVICVQRSPGNPLLTQVMTNIMTPQGYAAYDVTDSPETVSDLVNAGWKGNVAPSLLNG